MRRHVMLLSVLLASVITLSAPITRANVVYTYEGQNYTDTDDDVEVSFDGAYTTSMFQLASFTLTQPLPANADFDDFLSYVLEWTYFDGRNTLTSGADELSVFEFHTNAAGQIDGWYVAAQSFPAVIGDPVFSMATIYSFLGVISTAYIDICTEVDSSGYCVDWLYADGAFTERGVKPGVWSRVPEPGTLALFGLGLAGIPFVRRRRTPA